MMASPALDRPRVLVIGPFPPAVGGVARTLELLLRTSLAARFTIIPLSTTKRRRRDVPGRPGPASVPYAAWHSSKLLALILKYRPQIVYLKATSDTGFLRDLVLVRLAAAHGVPVLVHLHGRPQGWLFPPEGEPNRLARWGLGAASAVVALSPALARYFACVVPEVPVVVVPNVVEVDRFAPGTARAAARPFRILTVGRLSREKGTWDLIETAARVFASRSDVEFRLCGIGETEREEMSLRAECDRRGFAERVRFLGLLGEEDLRREYGAAHVFFLPSRAEIFPVVLLEAMAAGLPLVTTDVGAIPEMFAEGEHGFRHPALGLDGMAASILRLLGDDALRERCSAAARDLAARRYAAEAGADRVGALLADLAAGRAVAANLDWP